MLTAQQLRTQNRMQMVQRREESRQEQNRTISAQPTEEQLAQQEEYKKLQAEYEAQQKEASEWKQAEMWATKDIVITWLPAGIREKVKKIWAGEDALEQTNLKIEQINSGKAKLEEAFTPQQIQQMKAAGMIGLPMTISSSSAGPEERGIVITPAVAEKKEQTQPRFFVEEGLQKFGAGVQNVLSKVPAFNKTPTRQTYLPYQTRGTGQLTPTGEVVPVGEPITSQGVSFAQFGGQTATIAPYFIPYVGEGLLLAGGTERIIKAPTLGGKALGVLEVGIGAYGIKTRVGNLKLKSDIKNARTLFYAEESSGKGKSTIKTISRTTVGNKNYYGFTKQGVMDSPFNPEIKVGASRGYIIQGNKKVYPIDIATGRVQPYRDIFASRQAGKASRVIKDKVFTIRQEAGEGVAASSRIKNLKGGYTKARITGGFKPINAEDKFIFTGGDKIKQVLTPKGLVLRTKPNIAGMVKQVGTKEEDLFFSGGQSLKTNTLSKFSQERVAESVAQQRVLSLAAAKEGIKSTTGVSILSGLSQSLYIKQESAPVVATNLKQETRQEQAVTPVTTTRTETRITPISSSMVATVPVTRQLATPVQGLNLSTGLDTVLKTQVAQKQVSRMQQPTSPVPKIPLKTKTIAAALLNLKSKPLSKTGGSLSKLFEVLGRRYGKDRSLGTFRSQSEAETRLRTFLKGTLGASGKIKSNGKELGLKELISLKGSEFIPSKRESTRIVQARKFRLGTRGERVEIFRARKKNKKLSWF